MVSILGNRWSISLSHFSAHILLGTPRFNILRVTKVVYLKIIVYNFNNYCLHNETSIKIPDLWGSDSFQVGDHLEIMRGCDTQRT